MNIKKTLLTLMILTPQISFAANSFEPSLILGVKGGVQLSFDDDYHHHDPSNEVFGIYSGFAFTKNISWEIGYQKWTDIDADASNVSYDTWLVETAIRYDYYFRDNVSMYFKGGVVRWDLKKEMGSSERVNDSGAAPIAEVGFAYNMSNNWNANIGYQYIHGVGSDSTTGEFDTRALMAGITYRFGSY